MYVKLLDAAKVLGLKYNWLRNQCIAGTIPCMRTSERGKWLVDPEEVKAALQKKAA